jgi:hypothetical protein
MINLCELCTVIVESFRSSRKSSDDVQHSTKHLLTTKITKVTKDLDTLFGSKLRVLRVLRGEIRLSLLVAALPRWASAVNKNSTSVHRKPGRAEL